MTFSNRRTYPRHTLTAEGWIALAPGEEWKPISTVDMSQGGFGFISKERIEVEATCQFRLKLPDDAGLMNVQGRIAHCLDLSEAGIYRIGVQALSVDVIDVAAFLPASFKPQEV